MNARKWIADLPHRGLMYRTTVLVAACALAYAAIAPVAHGLDGVLAVVAAALAAAVCTVSAAAALVISSQLSGTMHGMAGVLLPMAARTGAPLIVAALVRLKGPGLVEAGFVYYLIGFYLLALAVEMPISLPRGTSVGQAESEGVEVHG